MPGMWGDWWSPCRWIYSPGGETGNWNMSFTIHVRGKKLREVEFWKTSFWKKFILTQVKSVKGYNSRFSSDCDTAGGRAQVPWPDSLAQSGSHSPSTLWESVEVVLPWTVTRVQLGEDRVMAHVEPPPGVGSSVLTLSGAPEDFTHTHTHLTTVMPCLVYHRTGLRLKCAWLWDGLKLVLCMSFCNQVKLSFLAPLVLWCAISASC